MHLPCRCLVMAPARRLQLDFGIRFVAVGSKNRARYPEDITVNVMTSAEGRFCTNCGGKQSVAGRCFACEPEVVANQSPPRQGRAVVALGVLLLLTLILASIATVSLGGRITSLSRDLRSAEKAGEASSNALQARVAALENSKGVQPDIPALVRSASRSVFGITAGGARGTAWIASSDATSAKAVTNYHVVADLWRAGRRSVTLHRGKLTYDGIIERVTIANDLALISIHSPLRALVISTATPAVGSQIVVIGAPLGLTNSVSTGVVSAIRRDFIQFTAAISPGSSGSPVVDTSGRVVAVAEAKAIADGAEGLGVAIPARTLCESLEVC